jgi:pyruvate,water dikinase
MGTHRKLKNPFEVETPKGAEGWEEMYPRQLLFSEELREYEEGKLWTYDAVHHMGVMYPFDMLIIEQEQAGFSQAGNRIMPVPTAYGTDYRVLNGYVYVSPNEVTDSELIKRRADVIVPRIKFATDNFELYFNLWKKKMAELNRELASIKVPRLPEFVTENILWEGPGFGTAYQLMRAFMRIIDGYLRCEQHHFEILVGAYGNYMALCDFVLKRVPGMDAPSVGRLCAGGIYDVLVPDMKLKELAQLAVDLKVDGRISQPFEKGTAPEQIMVELRKERDGEEWMDNLDEAREPWFHFAAGTGGFTCDHTSWNDDLRIPFEALVSYISLIKTGRTLGKTREEITAERDQITAEIRQQVPEEDREAFDKLLAEARTVYPYIEGHPFYCEHWTPITAWNKIREIGDVLVEQDFLEKREDIFYLTVYEIWPLLQEVVGSWAANIRTSGPKRLPGLIQRRKDILQALKESRPELYVGKVPEKVTEPLMVLLWGSSTEKLEDYLSDLSGERVEKLRGMGGSPGLVEGKARIIMSLEEANTLQEGEILVAPNTAPAWTPLFAKVTAVVVEVGGLMAHAAIIAREYGMPCVAGAADATRMLKTGDRISVDGSSGVVEIVDRAN